MVVGGSRGEDQSFSKRHLSNEEELSRQKGPGQADPWKEVHEQRIRTAQNRFP